MSDINPYRRLYEQHRDETPAVYCFNAVNNHCFPHFHSSIELVCVHSGCLTGLLDGESYDAHAGQILIVSGYMVHSYKTNEASTETILIIPLFLIPSLKKILRDNVFANPICEISGSESLKKLVEMIRTDWQSLGEETRIGMAHALLGMLIDRVGLVPRCAESRSMGVIKDVLIYLQDHYQSPVSMEELAKRFGYSKSRFSHLFNETLGCPPGAFVNALRCQHAARAILESDQTLLEISLSAGFECPRTFYRAFKQYYGMTPSQYADAQGGSPRRISASKTVNTP